MKGKEDWDDGGRLVNKARVIKMLRPPFAWGRLLLLMMGGLGLLFGLSACDIVAPPPATMVPTPTQLSNVIEFRTLSYRHALIEGESIPGTQLTFVRYQPDSRIFDISINGQIAPRRAGDSILWEGLLAPGVMGNYELTLNNQTFGGPYTSGDVSVFVLNPSPSEIDPTLVPAAADYLFEQVLIDYRVPLNREVPGTQLKFAGVTENGAYFEGTRPSVYPYLRQNDPLIWQGTLSQYVYVRYDLTVVSISESEIRLRGDATLWVNRRS